jgi:hypothetical protein
VKALSATDACRDRLTAFYHWNDRQSLAAAVEISRRRKVNLAAIRDWSTREGAGDKFQAFLESLGRARSTRRGARKSRAK